MNAKTQAGKPAGEGEARPLGLFALLPLTVGAFAVGTDAFVIAGLLPQVSHDLHVSVVAAGQMVTLFALTYALAAPVLAATLSRYPRQRLLLLALTIFVLANLGSALAPDFAVLAVTRVVAAFGAGLFTPNAAAAAALSVDPKVRGRALALVFGGLTVANVLGVPLGTFISVGSSWRWAFVFVAGLGAVALAGVLVWLRRLPPPFQVSLSKRIVMLRDPRVVTVLAAALVGSAAGFGFYVYLASELGSIAHVTVHQLPVYFLINGVAGVLGGQAGGWLVDRYPVSRVAAAGLVAMAAVLILVPYAGRAHVSAALFLAGFGFTSTFVYVPFQHRLTGLAPTAATELLALNSSALYLGIAFAAGLGGALLSATSARTLPVACGILAVLALVLFSGSYAARTQRASVLPSPDVERTSL
ncbi:MAG TPA: MFS transporter [Streptosporangiaceae bacterium]|nr:MFS transporter [Streptosporangiaceae bacterium]